MRRAISTILCVPLLCSLAMGQTGSSTQKVITSTTLEDFQKQVQALGFDCSRGKDDKGKDDTYFVFRAEGYKVAAFVSSPNIIELDNVFTDVHPSLADLNEWNRDHSLSRVYIDASGDVVLQNEIQISGGVTSETLNLFITGFRDSVVKWARFVLDKEGKK